MEAEAFDSGGRSLLQGLEAGGVAGQEQVVARFFTPSEVQGLIPLLEILFGRLLVGRQRRSEALAQLPKVPAERRPEVEAAIAELTETLRLLAERISAVGGQVKDFERGLVDFPCRRGSETVLLCWQYGEKKLAYWHTEHEGFTGRKRIETEDEEQAGALLN